MKCDFCNNRADYRTGDGHIHWCEDCYISMADDFEASYEDEYGMPFCEYYDVYEMYEDDYSECDCETEDDEDDSDCKIKNYYDSMREEFDPSYDER